MPVPKQKMAKSRTRRRRSHDALPSPATSVCSKCGEAKMPHRVCNHCGFYRDRKVMEIKEV
ncbi:MAG: 50S ribosomal protein L32 [bacterium]|nr:50S ribosomal protein L32 [bacterium]MDT8366157.1 50S ribosomal protein L32 [bacterium]